MGGTLLRPLLQWEHCVTLSPCRCQMPADHGRIRHWANFGEAQQGHRQLGLCQGPWQRRDSPRPTKALEDYLNAFSACTPLSVLARSCTTRHAGSQDHHTLQEQGREERLQQLQRHLPSQRLWQSLCTVHLDPTAEADRTCLSWTTVPLPSWKVNNRHGLLPSLTPGDCREQQMPLYIVTIDLTKAFDLVSRDGLFKILQKIGCPPKLQSRIESFHTHMKWTVQFNGRSSRPFDIRSAS